jgi:hypothetical protein
MVEFSLGVADHDREFGQCVPITGREGPPEWVVLEPRRLATRRKHWVDEVVVVKEVWRRNDGVPGSAGGLVVVGERGEIEGFVVGHGGEKREAWETPTCENFHKSGAAAGNSPRLCVEKPRNRCFGIKHIPKLCFELLI